jgi:hypothetical protein
LPSTALLTWVVARSAVFRRSASVGRHARSEAPQCEGESPPGTWRREHVPGGRVPATFEGTAKAEGRQLPRRNLPSSRLSSSTSVPVIGSLRLLLPTPGACPRQGLDVRPSAAPCARPRSGSGVYCPHASVYVHVHVSLTYTSNASASPLAAPNKASAVVSGSLRFLRLISPLRMLAWSRLGSADDLLLAGRSWATIGARVLLACGTGNDADCAGQGLGKPRRQLLQ